MAATKQQLFALLEALEHLPGPSARLDAERARALGLSQAPVAAFDGSVETLFALLELPQPPLDAVRSVIEVVADITRDPGRGASLLATLGMPLPPAPPQRPAPGSVLPVQPPPVKLSKKRSGMPRVLSYGGGLDSFAILVRSIELNDKPDVAIFMDVAGGTEKKNSPDPGEWPGTYKHIREVVIPMCKKAGIEFIWLGPQIPVRKRRSLYGYYYEKGQIPVKQKEKRNCTIMAKVERFETWLKQRFPNGQPVETWIGFEAGEADRIANDPNKGFSVQRKNRYPLFEWNWCRCRAEQYVRSMKLPVPRKSACVFCPYGKMTDWQNLAKGAPQLFKQVEELERRKMAKPTKKSGVRMAMMGYEKIIKGKDLPAKSIEGVHYRARPLGLYVQGKARPTMQKCDVCGAFPKATKTAGCDYLP